MLLINSNQFKGIQSILKGTREKSIKENSLYFMTLKENHLIVKTFNGYYHSSFERDIKILNDSNEIQRFGVSDSFFKVLKSFQKNNENVEISIEDGYLYIRKNHFEAKLNISKIDYYSRDFNKENFKEILTVRINDFKSLFSQIPKEGIRKGILLLEEGGYLYSAIVDLNNNMIVNRTELAGPGSKDTLKKFKSVVLKNSILKILGTQFPKESKLVLYANSANYILECNGLSLFSSVLDDNPIHLDGFYKKVVEAFKC